MKQEVLAPEPAGDDCWPQKRPNGRPKGISTRLLERVAEAENKPKGLRTEQERELLALVEAIRDEKFPEGRPRRISTIRNETNISRIENGSDPIGKMMAISAGKKFLAFVDPQDRHPKWHGPSPQEVLNATAWLGDRVAARLRAQTIEVQKTETVEIWLQTLPD